MYTIEGFGSTMDIYRPMMPVKTFYFEIPQKAKKVKVTADDTIIIDGAGKKAEILGRADQIRKEIDVTDSPLGAQVRPLFLHFDTEIEAGAPAAVACSSKVEAITSP